MLRSFIYNSLQFVLRKSGFQFVRPPPNPFVVQQHLVTPTRPVIFDVGAFIGEVASNYMRIFPQALMHCFEPFPDSHAALERNMASFPNAVCHRLALSDHEDFNIFHVNQNSQTNSLLSTDELGPAYWRENSLTPLVNIKVRTTTIDAFCLQQQLEHIDILKMDVQGAEYTVLQGARRLLSSHAVSLIYMELILCPTYTGQRKLQEYLQFLDSFGYELLDFYNPCHKGAELIQVDAIFLSKEFRNNRLKSITTASR